MIIAIKEKDKVVIGYSNTDFLCGLTDKYYVEEENVAIKFSETGNIFAFANMDRRSDIFLYNDDFLKTEVNPKTIIRTIIPYIKEKLIENDKPVDENGNWRNALVICNKNHIYDIDPMFGFYEANDYVCHGYRVETIKSVLDATTNLPAEERIMKAVTFSNKLHRENLFPIVITNTTSKTIKCIYQGEKTDEHIDSL